MHKNTCIKGPKRLGLGAFNGNERGGGGGGNCDVYNYHLLYQSNFIFPFSRNPANYKIVVGDHNRNTNEGTEEEVGAIKIISHPQYNTPRLSSDIALIQLSQAVKLSQRVNPICLPSHDTDIPTGSKCYITGGQGSTR